MKIDEIEIGPHTRPFVVAEMSGNHNGSLERSLELVRVAGQIGVQAIKLQTYTPDTMTIDSRQEEFLIKGEDNLWRGRYLYELFEEAHTPWEWHEPIMREAKRNGLLCFSSPFDETAVEFLETLKVPAYKIASFENTDLGLIRKVASTGKPLIISSGLASLEELTEAVGVARDEGCSDLALLKCTSVYPASSEDSNVLTIPHMREQFDCEVGLSDHTFGIGAAVAAVALGATLIEKHFTLSRDDGGVDAKFSLEPEEMKMVAIETKRAWKALGNIHYGPTKSEMPALESRRSLYVVEDIKCGDVLTKDNLRKIRPGYGLPPKYYDELLGLKVNQDIRKGTALGWDLIE